MTSYSGRQNRNSMVTESGLIPGLVGASPVQNIGAYGVEVGEFIHAVEVYDRKLKKFDSIPAQTVIFPIVIVFLKMIQHVM